MKVITRILRSNSSKSTFVFDCNGFCDLILCGQYIHLLLKGILVLSCSYFVMCLFKIESDQVLSVFFISTLLILTLNQVLCFMKYIWFISILGTKMTNSEW